jgi:hypothetical protein
MESDRTAKRAPAPWDYYYLRYFVGAVVGAGLLLALWRARSLTGRSAVPHGLPAMPHDWLDFAAAVTALGTAGLAYCYIASAPVLLLHATRFRFSRMKKWRPRAFRVTFLIVALAPVAVGVYCACTGLRLSLLPASKLRLLMYAPYVAVVALQLLGLMTPRLAEIRRFYHTLATNRAADRPDPRADEYVESYRHLREHGNAFLILLMEAVLASALYATQNAILLIGLVVTWIIPPAFSWFLGTWLEFEFPPRAQSSTSENEADGLRFRFGALFFGSRKAKPPDGRGSL